MDYETPTPREAWYGIGQWMAWLVILLCIATIIAVPILRRDRVLASQMKASEERPDAPLELAGRYVVGWNRMLPLRATAQKGTTHTLVSSLNKQSISGSDRLRIAMVRAELEGKEAAMKGIEALAAKDHALEPDAEILRQIYSSGGQAERKRDWESFEMRHGWFAKLAESFGKTASDPERAAVLAAAFRTIATMIVMLVLAMGAGLVGLGLLIAAIVLWSQGKWRCAFDVAPALPADRRAYLEALAFYLGGYIGISLVIRYVLNLGSIWGAVALPVGFAIAIIWPRLRGQSWAEWRATVGLHPGSGVLKELCSGLLGYIAGLPVLFAGFIVTMILSSMTNTQGTHPIVHEITNDRGTIILLFLLACVWAPITEELMFRGALFGHLRERLGWWPSALAVSLVFAIIHPQGWTAIPALMCIALVLAAIREWRGSILGCMAAHTLNNTLLIVALVMMIS